jgi:hypothetical protein
VGLKEDKARRDMEAFFTRRFADAEKAGDAAETERLAKEWLQADRENAKPYHKLATIHMTRGDLAGALDIATRGVARAPRDTHLMTLACTLCEQIGDAEGAARFRQQYDGLLNEDLARPGTTPRAFYNEAAALRDAGSTADAFARAQAGLTLFASDASLLKLGAQLAAALGDTDRALRYCHARAELPGQRGDALVSAADFLVQIYDTAGARAALEGAIEAGVPRKHLRIALARIAVLDRDAETGLALVDEQEAETGPTPHTEALRRKLLKRERAKAQKEGAIKLKSAATTELRAWAEHSGAPTLALDTPAQKLITPLGDIMLERAPGARGLVLVFGGLASMFGGAAEDLGDLVQAKRLNTIFLTDPQRLFMLNGLASVGDYPATLAWVRELSKTWDAPNLYCLGFSAGGYPAIRYGVDLGARRVLTFAAPTNFAPGITQIETRGIALLNRILTRKPDMCENLRDYLARFGAAAPEIINYYGQDMPEDAYHGRNIEGLPTVSSRPLAGVTSHGVILHSLKKNDLYRTLLSEFFRDCDA